MAAVGDSNQRSAKDVAHDPIAKRIQGRNEMTRTGGLFLAAIGIIMLSSAVLVSTPAPTRAEQAGAPALDDDDIGGIVTGPNGPASG